MPCWVVPSVAAELWGISVGEIVRRIESGELITHRENGWTFVDVAPGGPVLSAGKALAQQSRPRTYTPVTDEQSEQEEHADPEPEVSTFTDWRKARQRTARIRLAPPKFAIV